MSLMKDATTKRENTGSMDAIPVQSVGRDIARLLCLLVLLAASLVGSRGVRADIPDHSVFPAHGGNLLLWMSSERGRAEPEVKAAQKLATQGVEVWSLDPLGAYFLPPLPRSMDAVPPKDVAEWMTSALATGKHVIVYGVARAAVPLLRAAALLPPAQRKRLSVVLMYPNLYSAAEAMSEPDYLDLRSLKGLRVRVLQPRRSAATPWLPGLLAHLKHYGARVDFRILENLREGYWARETPTEYETAEGGRLDVMLLHEIKQMRKK